MTLSQFNNTKIVATIGPATCNNEMLKKLLIAGADVFRLNTSHGNQETHLSAIRLIRQISKDLGIVSTILLDLQGPKIRLGILQSEILLIEGQIVELVNNEQGVDGKQIPVDYPDFFKAVNAGDHIYINDGKVELVILSKEGHSVQAKVITGGEISSRKGINMPGVVTKIPAVTEQDKEYIRFGVKHGVDFFALSFVRTAQDIKTAQDIIKKNKGDIPIIAKIEKPQAVEHIDQILECSDGIMVARGDLGIEILPEKVPMVQKELIHRANIARKPVIVATQMLESMITEPIPTRAEANDVANAIIDGTDAIMLSGETTVGKYPLEAVEMMVRIAKNVEKSNLYQDVSKSFLSDQNSHDTSLIRLFNDVDIKAVIAITQSGFTAQVLSNSKISPPIIAVSNQPDLCRKMNILWGVLPFWYQKENLEFSDKISRDICTQLIEKKVISKGDKIVFLAGLPALTLNKTTVIKYFEA